MADTTTPNIGLTQPQPGGSFDTWGVKINVNFGIIDTEIANRLKKDGDTLAGQLQAIGGDASAPLLAVVGSEGSGLYSDEADTISVAIDGQHVATFSADGLVGTRLGVTGSLDLYVTTVLHAQLKGVQTDANNGGFDIYTRAGGTLTQRHRINKDGWLGLGRNDPAAMLDVNGSQAMNAVDMASATSINLALGNWFYRTVGGNVTLTIDNPPGARATGFILELTNGGAYTITWPASVRWPAGAAPVLTASGVDLLVFTTRDGGTTWRGMLSQKGSA